MSEFDRPDRAPRAARRRHLTILFSDLRGYTSLAGAVEPEDCLRVIDDMRACAARVVAKYGGTVIDFHGDGVLAMFGYPEPTERDGRSATEAALELHAAIRQMPLAGALSALPPLRLHTGVHSGLVLLIENDPAPGQYLLLGECVPIAQRLSAHGGDDEILVSAATLGAESRLFEVRERGYVTLKGKTKPVVAIQVLDRAAAHNQNDAKTVERLTPFVGRVRELEQLHRHFAEVVSGGMREVAIIASAGVGKTRLVEQFLHELYNEQIRIFRGYCETHLGAVPLQPFLQMLRHAASGDIAEQLRAWDNADSVAEAFAAMADGRPLVLFIDDWQWADDATKHTLARLRALQPPSVLVLIASREVPSDSAASAGDVIELNPFDPREAAEAIRRLRPDVDPFAAREIQQLSGGNPLFLEELCHSTSHETSGREVGGGDSLPAWLSRLIASRVERLPARQRELIRDAAVIGAAIPGWLLEAVSGCGPGDPMLTDLAAVDLIYPAVDVANGFRFKHEITRDVVYASVGRDERQVLHRRIATLLEARAAAEGAQESLLAPLSHHFRAGGDAERAAHYAELAGDEAMAAAAADRARGQYAAALDDLRALPSFDVNYERWSRIAHRFGLACVFDPARAQLDTFAQIAELARARGDSAGLARAQYWLGFIQYALGNLRPAIDHYELARGCCASAQADGERTANHAQVDEMAVLDVQLVAAVGQARAAAGEHDVAIRLLDEALAVKRQHRRKTRAAVGSAYALACKGAVLGDLGRFAEAYDCFGEAIEAVQVGHPAVEGSVIGWRSAVNLWQGEWREALETAERSQSLAQRVGSLYVLAMGQSVAAYATWMLGQTVDSIDVIARSTSWLEARDKRLSISLSYGWLADIYAAVGNVGEARLCAAKAIRRARHGDSFGAPMSYRALAALPSAGRQRTAEFYLAEAMRSSTSRSPRERAVTLLHQGQHAVRAARPAEAIPLLEQAREAFISMGMPWHDAEAQRCLTEVSASFSKSEVRMGEIDVERSLTRS